MSARTLFNATLEDRWTRYGLEEYSLDLYVYPIIINDDYTITGTRAVDSSDDPISGTDKGDGQYGFEDVAYGEYVIVAYRAGIRPQVVNGYDRFIVLPKLGADEIVCSETDATILKTKLNTIIQYILDNDSGWSGTPPTLIT